MRISRLSGGLIALALGCGSGSTTPDATVARVTFTPAAIDTLFSLGEGARLSAVARDRSGAPMPGAAIAYQSSATGVATVTQEGAVTAVGNGAATITATAGQAAASTTVRVRQKLARTIVTPATAATVVGRTVTVSATGVDGRGNTIAGLPAATFTSSAPGIALVDRTGIVTGAGVGTATITAEIASAADGRKSGTAVVTVAAAAPLTATVTMGATTFTPGLAEVAVGGTVTWVNGSGVAHDVDFGTLAARIPIFESGQRSMTFPSAGRFEYHCNLHSGMDGTIVVR